MTLPIRNKSRIFIIKIQSGILYNIPLFRDSVGALTRGFFQSFHFVKASPDPFGAEREPQTDYSFNSTWLPL